MLAIRWVVSPIHVFIYIYIIPVFRYQDKLERLARGDDSNPEPLVNSATGELVEHPDIKLRVFVKCTFVPPPNSNFRAVILQRATASATLPRLACHLACHRQRHRHHAYMTAPSARLHRGGLPRACFALP